MDRQEETPESLGGTGGSKSGTTDCKAEVRELSTDLKAATLASLAPTAENWLEDEEWDGGWTVQSLDDKTLARCWLFVMYEESAPKNWRQRMINLQVPIAISPLHCNDYNPVTGVVKKAHRHGIAYFQGKKSFKQVRELLQMACGAPRIAVCQSLPTSVRYLCHLDCDEETTGKVRYPINEVLWFGGVPDEWQTYLTTTGWLQQANLMRVMMRWIDENDVLDMKVFLDEAYSVGREQWALALKNQNVFLQIREYVKGRYNAWRRDLDTRPVPVLVDGERMYSITEKKKKDKKGVKVKKTKRDKDDPEAHVDENVPF